MVIDEHIALPITPASTRGGTALRLSLSTTTLSEYGGQAIGTVTRDIGDITAELVVHLELAESADATTRATVPHTVTIPAGERSASFTLTAVDNGLLEGAQVVQLWARSSEHITQPLSVSFIDNEFALVPALDINPRRRPHLDVSEWK